MIRAARQGDAEAIGSVYVAAWRSAYAGLLPSDYLAAMSAQRLARRFRADITGGRPVVVAEAGGEIAGFCAGGLARTQCLADGEIETLYVHDDHREQGLGRALLCAGAERLAASGCASLFLWVLQDNPSRWFYERLGGRPVRRGIATVARQEFAQLAYLWDPIARLTTAARSSAAE